MTDYNNFSKEQLEIFCHNKNLEIERAERKLLLLTGCSCFGDLDGMDGTCVWCSEKDSRMWERCHIFKYAFKEYLQKNGDN